MGQHLEAGGCFAPGRGIVAAVMRSPGCSMRFVRAATFAAPAASSTAFASDSDDGSVIAGRPSGRVRRERESN